MLHRRPRSPSPEPRPCWAPQPQGPRSAKRRRLQEPAGHDEPLAPPDMEVPTPAASEELIPMAVLDISCVLQVQVDGGGVLLLEPQLTLVTQVALPGHTLFLVTHVFRFSAPLGQPEFLTTSPQEAALLQPPQDQLVFVTTEYILENNYQQDACDEDQNSGFQTPWIGFPPGQASERSSSSMRMSSPWTPDYDHEPRLQVLSPNTARNILDLDSYLLGPFPTSPLQPLPPSPPPSPQEQGPARPERPARPARPVRSPRAPCKARRRLLYE